MRRIILGAIWLTGFLAVLLSWGMMWGRAQGEGPSRIIGVEFHSYDACQLTAVFPETGVRVPFADGLQLSCQAIGWTNDNEWFYYLYLMQFEPSSGGTYRVERISPSFRKPQVIIENLVGGTIYLTPDTRRLVYLNRETGQTDFRWFVSDPNGNHAHMLMAEIQDNVTFPSFPPPLFSPDSQAMIVTATSETEGSDYLYWANLDGEDIKRIPNYRGRETYAFLWTDDTQWVVIINHSFFSNDCRWLCKIHPDGSDLTPLWSNNPGWGFTSWWHQSGIIGLTNGDQFRAMSVDTGALLWQLNGVAAGFIRPFEGYSPYPNWRSVEMPLNEDWVHFRLTDGRLVRIRYDGADLRLYNTRKLLDGLLWNFSVSGWSPSGEWVWIHAPVPPSTNSYGTFRVHQGAEKIESITASVSSYFWQWSPDERWVYYYGNGNWSDLRRIRADGRGPSETVAGPNFGAITFTPPYQAEWQPTHTLMIGIGLMSFSTLTPIVLWRRRRKPRQS